MRPKFCISVLVLSLITFPASAKAQGPSFDCAKARNAVEKTICASSELSQLDREIALAYRAALANGATTKTIQASWLKFRDNACSNKDLHECLLLTMKDRAAALVGNSLCFALEPALHKLLGKTTEGLIAPALARQFPNFLHIDNLKKDMSLIELKQQISSALPMPAAFWQKLESTGNGKRFSWRFAGLSDLSAIESDAKPGQCRTFILLDAKRGSFMDIARQLINPFSKCDGDSISLPAWLATIQGRPAVIYEGIHDNNYFISITSYSAEDFERECNIQIRFSNKFDIKDSFCPEKNNCQPFERASKEMISEVDKNFQKLQQVRILRDEPSLTFSFPKNTAFDLRRFSLTDNEEGPLPTFGSNVSDDYVTFEKNSVFIPVSIAGKQYTARIGHAMSGEMITTNYLVAYYEWRREARNTFVQPVAGLVLKASRVGRPQISLIDNSECEPKSGDGAYIDLVNGLDCHQSLTKFRERVNEAR